MLPTGAHRRWAMPAVAAVIVVSGCSTATARTQPTGTGASAAASTGSSPAAAAKAAAGAQVCSAITRADLIQVGLRPDLTRPGVSRANSGQGAYCTYTRASGAEGGIEFDWFRNDSPVQTWQTVLAGATYPAGIEPAGLARVAQSQFSPGAVAGGPQFAIIAVRRGDLVFDISVPAGQKARRQLTRLARLVLRRMA